MRASYAASTYSSARRHLSEREALEAISKSDRAPSARELLPELRHPSVLKTSNYCLTSTTQAIQRSKPERLKAHALEGNDYFTSTTPATQQPKAERRKAHTSETPPLQTPKSASLREGVRSLASATPGRRLPFPEPFQKAVLTRPSKPLKTTAKLVPLQPELEKTLRRTCRWADNLAES
eukprot:1047797-Pleurochrysis_carterae.AAC.1